MRLQPTEEGFRPLAGLTPWDARELHALMHEVAEEYPPDSDREAILWGWVVTVVERWIRRGKAVPAQLLLSYKELIEEHARAQRIAGSLAELLTALPEAQREPVAHELLELAERRHREAGAMVPMWVTFSRALYAPFHGEEPKR